MTDQQGNGAPAAADATPRRSALGRRLALGSALTAGVIAGAALVYNFSGSTVPALTSAGGAPQPATPLAATATAEQLAVMPMQGGMPSSLADLVERVSPAVVSVSAEVESGGNAQERLQQLPEQFREFFERFGMPQPESRRGVSQGSGFVIDGAGYIVTNNHVVEDAKEITVTFGDQAEFKATLVGRDAATDVALLKIEPAGRSLVTVQFADDRQVRVGDWVIAVGNPFGLGGTVTAGIVSSLGRDIGGGPYTDFIQVDAPINRGNSGGPTFNLAGQVIGMNTAIFSPSGGSVGIGFAIPSTLIQDIVRQIREQGGVTRGWLGVQIEALSDEMAASLGIQESRGAIVGSIVAGSPAERAGFRVGDVILGVNGQNVENNRDLTRRVGALPVDQDARFTVWRSGQQMEITARIEKRDDQRLASTGPGTLPGSGEGAGEGSKFGLSLAPLTPEVRQAYSLEEGDRGVVITRIDEDGEAATKGLRRGMRILRVNNEEVNSPADFDRAVAAARAAGRPGVLLLVAADETQRFITLSLDQG